MPRTSTTKSLDFNKLLSKLKSSYPDINFISADYSSWSDSKQSIFYNKDSDNAKPDLLHEIGHMLCDHKSYSSDLSLLSKELEAWNKARDIGKELSISISENYINKCIDSYRQWIHGRSLCPKCSQTAVEVSDKKFKCINCHNTWQVSSAQESRTYKKSLN